MIVVGLGEVAKTHLAVLETMSEVAVVGGVDIAVRGDVSFRGETVPIYESVAAASRELKPTLAVIATPTPTHFSVCNEVVSAFPGVRILSEKPLATNSVDMRAILDDLRRFPQLKVAYHLQHAPEVRWGLGIVNARRATIGVPIGARSVFTDPYEGDFASATARFGSSWLDSGINALSVFSQFCEISDRRSLRQLGSREWSIYEARFNCGSAGNEFEGTIVTSWHVTSASKTTTIDYSSGAALLLDHTAVAGYLLEDRRVVTLFGTDGAVDRRYSHYLAFYRDYFAGAWVTGRHEDIRLHELLLS
ncbi:MAG TPA: Gfo/Idh/MocA family oxidoreductase [Pseudonocardiaceae bacterium]|nr:Gfo/Idh/MocA family oxidoreductase [Pseudonocardiaceae bacterium]